MLHKILYSVLDVIYSFEDILKDISYLYRSSMMFKKSYFCIRYIIILRYLKFRINCKTACHMYQSSESNMMTCKIF